MASKIHPDWALVMQHGGAKKLAHRLGYREPGGQQRVQNWKTRGIPAQVKLDHPSLFRRKKDNGRSATNHPHERASDRAPA